MGEFKKTNVEELYKLIGLLIYMGLVQAPTLHDYWSTSSLFHGLWARAFMGRDRFKALLGFLQIDDPRTEEGSYFHWYAVGNSFIIYLSVFVRET